MLSGCLACQMGLGFSYIFSTFLKDIVDDFGWSRAGFALGASPMLLAYALASPVIGGLTDRRGARTVLTGGALVLGLSLACFGAMQEYWHYAVTTFLFGFALTGLGDIPVGAVAARWFERGRGFANIATVNMLNHRNIATFHRPIDGRYAVRTIGGWIGRFGCVQKERHRATAPRSIAAAVRRSTPSS